MIFNWWKIFNIAEFDATGLVSRTYTLNLQTLGEKEVLVTKGITYGITYDEVFLPLNLNSKNPFVFEGYAIYSKDNGDVFLGKVVDES